VGVLSVLTDGPRRGLVSRLLPPLTYLIITLVFWGRFVLERGLHAETVWIELSQQRPGWEGFLYPYDPSRRFMSVPFHAAYLLSDGSYLPLHLIFGLLVFLTGWLTWVLVKRLFPAAPLLAFLAGALALVHGADLSTNTTPMIVVRQSVVAALGASVCFRLAWESRRPWLLLPVAALQALSLWTYEPGLLLLSAVPLLIWSGRADVRRWLWWTAGWTAVPALFVGSLVQRYLVEGASSYQASKIASHVDPVVAGQGLLKLVYNGIAFWDWPVPWYRTQMQGCVDEVSTRIAPALIAGTAAFAVLALLQRRNPLSVAPRRWVSAAAISAVCLVLAYLPFLALGEVGAWRTQFYAAPPAAVLLALVFTRIDSAVRARGWLAMLLATAVAASGMFVGLVSQLEMSYRWRIHRQVMDGIVQAAPRLRDETLVVLSNVPTGFPYPVCDGAPPVDPFLDTYWFNSALRVLYPRANINGVYWRADRSSPGAIQYQFDDSGAKLLRSNTTTPDSVPYDRIVAFRYDPQSGSHLVEPFPAGEIPGSVPSPRYAPRSRILPGPPPGETLNRLAQ
jgi:hypothetical protein